MKRFKKILVVPGDGPAAATAATRAIDLAKRNRASLAFLEVVNPPSRLLRAVMPQASFRALQRGLKADARKGMSRFADKAKAAGVRASVRVREGRPFVQVIREVLANGRDLVVIGEDAREESPFGTLHLHLIRKCPCPVWVVKRSRRRTYANILAAVDPRDEQQRGLARKVLELASSLARIENGHLHIVHAWGLNFDELLKRPSGMTRETARRYETGIERLHRKPVEELLAGCDLAGVPHTLHLVHDAADDAIVHAAQRHKVDVIVMGTLSPGALRGVLIGRTAEAILGRIDCSLLAVKPDDFVSPIELEER